MFNRRTGRPAADGVIDATKYEYLTEAQSDLISAIATRFPDVLYPHAASGSFPTLSTTDNNIWTFGTDSNGYAIAPIGRTAIYQRIEDIPDRPLRRGKDYLDEGTQIRVPNNRTLGGPLYWRGVTSPADIDATHQPSLMPEGSRDLIVTLAAKSFAEGGGLRNPALADRMAVKLGDPWAGAPGDFARWCLAWRTAFKNGGALQAVTGLALAISSGGGGPIVTTDDGLYGDALFGLGQFLPL